MWSLAKKLGSQLNTSHDVFTADSNILSNPVYCTAFGVISYCLFDNPVVCSVCVIHMCKFQRLWLNSMNILTLGLV